MAHWTRSRRNRSFRNWRHPKTNNYHSWFWAPWRQLHKNYFCLQKNAFSLQKNAFSYRKMHFPAEKCIFLQKNALSCRKIRFSGGTSQEIAGGFRAQESRTRANFHKMTVELELPNNRSLNQKDRKRKKRININLLLWSGSGWPRKQPAS